MAKPISLVKVEDNQYFLIVSRNADIDYRGLAEEIKERWLLSIIIILSNYADED